MKFFIPIFFAIAALVSAFPIITITDAALEKAQPFHCRIQWFHDRFCKPDGDGVAVEKREDALHKRNFFKDLAKALQWQVEVDKKAYQCVHGQIDDEDCDWYLKQLREKGELDKRDVSVKRDGWLHTIVHGIKEAGHTVAWKWKCTHGHDCEITDDGKLLSMDGVDYRGEDMLQKRDGSPLRPDSNTGDLNHNILDELFHPFFGPGGESGHPKDDPTYVPAKDREGDLHHSIIDELFHPFFGMQSGHPKDDGWKRDVADTPAEHELSPKDYEISRRSIDATPQLPSKSDQGSVGVNPIQELGGLPTQRIRPELLPLILPSGEPCLGAICPIVIPLASYTASEPAPTPTSAADDVEKRGVKEDMHFLKEDAKYAAHCLTPARGGLKSKCFKNYSGDDMPLSEVDFDTRLTDWKEKHRAAEVEMLDDMDEWDGEIEEDPKEIQKDLHAWDYEW